MLDTVLEELAKILHESGRKAVEQGKVYRNDLPVKPFAEWDELTEAAQEGRILMAEYLVEHAEEVVRILEATLPEDRP